MKLILDVINYPDKEFDGPNKPFDSFAELMSYVSNLYPSYTSLLITVLPAVKGE